MKSKVKQETQIVWGNEGVATAMMISTDECSFISLQCGVAGVIFVCARVFPFQMNAFEI